ncbi:hypothetical protein HYPDE_35018 [Hyphomicrobium denitrificans 1NES1]|uniref:Uncharacterized protein n=1 Tax=Hyphomicrobium denitrificans 1NES1 TaxID=670307 RepID=N0BEX5_9HYPH|nr:hypothetical protein HYPDE_35018 [Hyphomicrobium denitrificans 1NES1]
MRAPQACGGRASFLQNGAPGPAHAAGIREALRESDYADAEAICEAVARPNMAPSLGFVPDERHLGRKT